MNERDKPADRRTLDAVLLTDVCDRRDLGIDFRAALANGKITPDAGVAFGVRLIEGMHRGDAGAGSFLTAAGCKRFGVETIEAERLDTLRLGDGQRLASECPPDRQQLGPGDAIRNRSLTQRLREQE